MQRERGWRTVIRSVLAVFAGIVVLTVTSFAIEWATEPVLAGFFPTLSQKEPRRITSSEN